MKGIDKRLIGAPSNFRHSYHIGIDNFNEVIDEKSDKNNIEKHFRKDGIECEKIQTVAPIPISNSNAYNNNNNISISISSTNSIKDKEKEKEKDNKDNRNSIIYKSKSINISSLLKPKRASQAVLEKVPQQPQEQPKKYSQSSSPTKKRLSHQSPVISPIDTEKSDTNDKKNEITPDKKLSLLTTNTIKEENSNVKGLSPLANKENEISGNESIKISQQDELPIVSLNKKNLNKLFLICMNGDVSKLKKLLEKNDDIDLNDKTEEGWSALHVAAFNNNYEIAKYLINHGFSVDIENESYTPSYVASQEGNLEVLKLLVENGAEINKKSNGWDSIQIACYNNQCDVVKYLLSKTTESNNNSDLLLHIATENNNLRLLKVLLNEGYIDVNTKDVSGWAALHIAARDNYYDIVKYLIKDKRTDIDIEDQNLNTPLYIASQYGHYSIVQLLINNKANINFKNIYNWTPLHIACLNEHTEVVAFLLENNAKLDAINRNGITALHLACVNNNKNIIQLLMDYNASINKMTFNNWTPLQIATYYNNPVIVDFIIKKLLQLNISCDNIETIMNIAYKLNYKDVQNMLDSYKEFMESKKENMIFYNYFNNEYNNDDSNYRDEPDEEDSVCKFEILTNEIKNDRVENAIKIIETKKIGLECIDKNGWTALHWACYNGYKDIVQLLINNKADIEKKTKHSIDFNAELKNKTALEIARIKKNKEIEAIISSYIEEGKKYKKKNK